MMWTELEPGDLIVEVKNNKQQGSWAMILSVSINKYDRYVDCTLINLTYYRKGTHKKSHVEKLPATVLVVRNGEILGGKSLPTKLYKPYAP